jgi:regulator of sigma E protease
LDKSPTPERPDNVTPLQGSPGAAPPIDAETGAPTSAPPPPLTPMAWLTNNGIYLMVMLAGVIWLYRYAGFDGLWRGLLVVFGLGLVIFIHELGHFLAARWCDVHIQTFSIGFGPALPGCSFKRGETLYMIGILPLGGYVSMVGEGTEVEENEDYPRSFKNKTVLQRMLIISAGVIMNILLGALFFILVYRLHGVEKQPADVSTLEAGGPAWKAAVRTDSRIIRIDDLDNPFFEDLKIYVALSSQHHKIPFTFVWHDGTVKVLEIEPRRDGNDKVPVIGVAPPARLKLSSAKSKKFRDSPVPYSSPAASARVIELEPGDVVVKATDPAKDDDLTPLDHSAKDGSFDVAELCRRMQKLGSKPLVLEVVQTNGKADAKPRRIEVEAVGFDYGDSIVGTTDPANPDQTFKIKPLPPSPSRTDKNDDCDLYEFRKRLRELAGKPIVVQVLRDADPDKTPVNILVPPAFHHTFGVFMKIGEVSAVRDNSPAAEAGMQATTDTTRGDELKKITVDAGDGPKEINMDDPTRIPFELARAARARKDKSKPVKVEVTVLRPNPENHKGLEDKVLKTMIWDDSWDFQDEGPINLSSPLSIPQLGIAYRIQTTATKVVKDSPAEKAGIKENDVFDQFAFREGGKTRDAVEWSQFLNLYSLRGPNNTRVFDRWACIAWTVQRRDFYEIKVMVKRGDEKPEAKELKAEPDATWPLEDNGLLESLISETRLTKADTIPQALSFGLHDTAHFIKVMYLQIGSLASGRIAADQVGGPIKMAEITFAMASDPYALMWWLGIISLNLAVVNFLPIPMLDGGHMVFLIYEGLRGRRPSETFQAVMSYVGLAMILSLIVFVFYNDIGKLFRLW